MKYFRVEKEVVVGKRMVGTCASDGSPIDGFNEVEPYAGDTFEMTIGFSVWGWDDNEEFEEEWYPVKTDMDTTDFNNNEDEVLEKIKADHPAGEWENFEW